MHMRTRLMLLIALTGVLAMTVLVSAQAPKPGAKPYSPPRTPDGHPDLQGMYDLATLTPVERPAGAKAALTDEEARKLERNVATQAEIRGRDITGERTAPPR